MDKDIIYNEQELAIAANSIATYAGFLSRCIDDYISILNDIQANCINDDLITSKLSELASSLAPYSSYVCDEGEGISSNVNKSISDVEKADNFRSTEGIKAFLTSTFNSLLAQFL